VGNRRLWEEKSWPRKGVCGGGGGGGGLDVGKQYRISAWDNFVFCCRPVRSAGSAGSVAAPLIATPLTLTERLCDISRDCRLCAAAEVVVGFEVMTAV